MKKKNSTAKTKIKLEINKVTYRMTESSREWEKERMCQCQFHCMCTYIFIARDQRERYNFLLQFHFLFIWAFDGDFVTVDAAIPLCYASYCQSPIFIHTYIYIIYSVEVWAGVLLILFLFSVLLIFRFSLHYRYTQPKCILFLIDFFSSSSSSQLSFSITTALIKYCCCCHCSWSCATCRTVYRFHCRCKRITAIRHTMKHCVP